MLLSFHLSQGDFRVSAPADVHGPGDRGPAGVGVCQGLPVQGEPTASCLRSRFSRHATHESLDEGLY